jgi:hypothetical protein
MRNLAEIITDINVILEDNLASTENYLFKGLATLQPLDGKTFPMIRISDKEAEKISPLDSKGLIFYHRVISELNEPVPGKGASNYQMVTYSMRLIGVGYRPNIVSATTWNNEDRAREALKVLGNNVRLSGGELAMARGQTVTDKLTVLNTEYAGNDTFKHKVLELFAFSIDYTIRARVICDTTVPVPPTPISAFSYSNNGQTVESADFVTMVPSTTPSVGTFNYYLDANDTLPTNLSLNEDTGYITRTGTIPNNEYSFDVILVGSGLTSGVAVVTVQISITGDVAVLTPDEITGGLTFWTKAELLARTAWNAGNYQLNNEANAALNAQLKTGGGIQRLTTNETVVWAGTWTEPDEYTIVIIPLDHTSLDNSIGVVSGANPGSVVPRSNLFQSNYQTFLPNPSYPIGTSDHISIVKRSGVMYGFKNGVQFGSVASGSNYNYSCYGRIGGGYGNYNNSNIAMFPTALTDEQIAEFYQKPLEFISLARAYSATLIHPLTEGEYYKNGEIINYATTGTTYRGTLTTTAAGSTYNTAHINRIEGLQSALHSFNIYKSTYLGNIRKQRILGLSNTAIEDFLGQPIPSPWKIGLLNFWGGLHGGVVLQSALGNLKSFVFSIKVDDASVDQTLFDLGTPGTISIVNGEIVAPAFSYISGGTITDNDWCFVVLKNGSDVNSDETQIIPADVDCQMVPPVTYAEQITEDASLEQYFQTLYN